MSILYDIEYEPEDIINNLFNQYEGTWKGIKLEDLDDDYLNNIINFLKRKTETVPYILRLEKRIRNQ